MEGQNHTQDQGQNKSPWAPPGAQLTSGEEVEYAGFWIRVGASILDSLLFLVITAPLMVMIYGWEYYDEGGPMVMGSADFLISWVFPAVVVISFWVYRQATPGKMAVSAKIVDATTGEPPSTGQMIGRYLGYYISIIPLFLGIIWVAFDKRKQGWHDKLANTVVIRHRGGSTKPVGFTDPK